MSEQATQKDAYRLVHQGILAFGRAERQGIRIDLDYCKQTTKQLTEEIEDLRTEFQQTKFYRHWKHSLRGKKPNLTSNAQLGSFLYKTKKIKPKKTTATGKGSTDEEALLGLGIPELEKLLRMRKLLKIRDTYLNGFIKEQVDGFVHPFFNLHTVRTHRSSSDRPNFQNIPKRDAEAAAICRQALYPREGCQLLEVDYSGIEVSISACYHKDPNMIKYIKDPSSDMHGDMAEQIFFLDKLDKSIAGHKTLRSAAKNGFVFPQFYGDYYGNNAMSLAHDWGKLPEGRWGQRQGIEIEDGLFLSDHLRANGIKSITSFTNHLKEIERHFWEERFAVYNTWKEKVYRKYQRTGYVELLTGFKCYGPMGRNDATNYPIQGAAFHCLLWAFIELDKELRRRKMETRLIGQIHDAIIADVVPVEKDEFLSMLRPIMIDALKEAWPWIIVPLDVEVDMGDIDASWNDLKTIPLP